MLDLREAPFLSGKHYTDIHTHKIGKYLIRFTKETHKQLHYGQTSSLVDKNPA